MNTLKYAKRARNIENNVTVNIIKEAELGKACCRLEVEREGLVKELV